MSHPDKPQVSALDAVIPTNPLAAISCYAGIFSVICCFVGFILGPIAILCGVLSLTIWKVPESSYGKTASTVRTWIGIITGILGTIIGIFALINFLMGNRL